MRKKARRHGGTKARSKGAAALDRFDLYELAVTSPVPLARFLRAVHGGRPRTLGEDFSGAAALSRAWVELDPEHRAIAIDKDPTVIAALASKVARLSEACAKALVPIRSNVLRATHPCDIVACTNFPICYWHTRPALLKYLKHARSRLNRRGIFVADLYGGSDAFQTGKQTVHFRQQGQRIEYTWEQRKADPISGRVQNAIHFRLGGRAIRNAFEYDWRLWSIPELSEALLESGFRKVEIYDSLGDAMDQHGNVMIQPAEDLDDPYVVYVVARA